MTAIYSAFFLLIFIVASCSIPLPPNDIEDSSHSTQTAIHSQSAQMRPSAQELSSDTKRSFLGDKLFNAQGSKRQQIDKSREQNDDDLDGDDYEDDTKDTNDAAMDSESDTSSSEDDTKMTDDTKSTIELYEPETNLRKLKNHESLKGDNSMKSEKIVSFTNDFEPSGTETSPVDVTAGSLNDEASVNLENNNKNFQSSNLDDLGGANKANNEERSNEESNTASDGQIVGQSGTSDDSDGASINVNTSTSSFDGTSDAITDADSSEISKLTAGDSTLGSKNRGISSNNYDTSGDTDGALISENSNESVNTNDLQTKNDFTSNAASEPDTNVAGTAGESTSQISSGNTSDYGGDSQDIEGDEDVDSESSDNDGTKANGSASSNNESDGTTTDLDNTINLDSGIGNKSTDQNNFDNFNHADDPTITNSDSLGADSHNLDGESNSDTEHTNISDDSSSFSSHSEDKSDKSSSLSENHDEVSSETIPNSTFASQLSSSPRISYESRGQSNAVGNQAASEKQADGISTQTPTDENGDEMDDEPSHNSSSVQVQAEAAESKPQESKTVNSGQSSGNQMTGSNQDTGKSFNTGDKPTGLTIGLLMPNPPAPRESNDDSFDEEDKNFGDDSDVKQDDIESSGVNIPSTTVTEAPLVPPEAPTPPSPAIFSSKGSSQTPDQDATTPSPQESTSKSASGDVPTPLTETSSQGSVSSQNTASDSTQMTNEPPTPQSEGSPSTENEPSGQGDTPTESESPTSSASQGDIMAPSTAAASTGADMTVTQSEPDSSSDDLDDEEDEEEDDENEDGDSSEDTDGDEDDDADSGEAFYGKPSDVKLIEDSDERLGDAELRSNIHAGRGWNHLRQHKNHVHRSKIRAHPKQLIGLGPSGGYLGYGGLGGGVPGIGPYGFVGTNIPGFPAGFPLGTKWKMTDSGYVLDYSDFQHPLSPHSACTCGPMGCICQPGSSLKMMKMGRKRHERIHKGRKATKKDSKEQTGSKRASVCECGALGCGCAPLPDEGTGAKRGEVSQPHPIDLALEWPFGYGPSFGWGPGPLRPPCPLGKRGKIKKSGTHKRCIDSYTPNMTNTFVAEPFMGWPFSLNSNVGFGWPFSPCSAGGCTLGGQTYINNSGR